MGLFIYRIKLSSLADWGFGVKNIYDDSYRALIGQLTRCRKQARITQQQLADQLGKPQSFVAKIETHERRLDIIEFIRICHLIGVSPAWVIAQVFPESSHAAGASPIHTTQTATAD